MALRADIIDAVDLEAIRAAREVDMIDYVVRAVRVAEGYRDGRALMRGTVACSSCLRQKARALPTGRFGAMAWRAKRVGTRSAA